MYNPTKKSNNQNLFDFILQNYGSLDGLESYLKDKTSVYEFSGKKIGSIIPIPSPTRNSVTKYVQGREVIIATGDDANYFSGDYNDDYNNDFLN